MLRLESVAIQPGSSAAESDHLKEHSLSQRPEPKCCRCQQELSPGMGFCVACGFDNTDLHSKRFEVEQKAEQRIYRAKLFANLFRILGWVRILRWIR